MPVRHATLGPWKLATPFGIELNEGGWNTGSVSTVCALANDRLLLGTEQGGLWISEPASGSYQSHCLSDSWSHRSFACCTQDPQNPNRVFFGCAAGVDSNGGVYVGNMAAQPSTWVFVAIPDSIAIGGAGTGVQSRAGVYSMIILPGQRLLVVATSLGIGWTQIDSLPFTWQTAPINATSLANLAGDEFLFVAEDQSNGLQQPLPTLHRGSISGATLNSATIPQTAVRWTRLGKSQQFSGFAPKRIGSCKNDPQNAYCLGSIERNGTTHLFVISSQDNGKTWKEGAYATDVAGQTLNDILDFFNLKVKSDGVIAVHPTRSDIVAIGFKNAALSTDGGKTWTGLSGLAGAHADIHELVFRDEPLLPPGPAAKRSSFSLFIPSDGGILRRTPPGTGDSRRNRTLPIVMLYGPDNQSSFGNLDVGAGLIVAGSQDNANLWCDQKEQVWRNVAGGGDGGGVAVSAQGGQTTVLHSQSLNDLQVRWARRQSATAFGPPAKAAVWLNGASLDLGGLLPIYLRPVSPHVGLPRTMAIASPAKSNVVYAAVSPVLDPAGAVISQDVQWIPFGKLPAGEIVSSLEAHDKQSILVGTRSGRLFLIAGGGSPSEIPLNPPWSDAITAIASNGKTIMCVGTMLHSSPGSDGTIVSYLYMGPLAPVRHGTGKRWKELPRLTPAQFPPNDGTLRIHAACANRLPQSERLFFAATVKDNEVWVCKSNTGTAWQRMVRGLPHAVRCSDVMFSEAARAQALFLSTYGRGVWQLTF